VNVTKTLPLAEWNKEKNMTYRRLAEEISKMTDEQKDMDVTIMDHDEEFHAARLETTTDDMDCPAAMVLDEGHPYLSMKTLV
jgi:hypothetical protein